MKLVFTAEARLDLFRIGDAIANDSPQRAVSFVEELEGRCRNIIEFPLRFPLLPGRESNGIRRIVHGNYLIFYRLLQDDEAIVILRILNGAQDYDLLLSLRE